MRSKIGLRVPLGTAIALIAGAWSGPAAAQGVGPAVVLPNPYPESVVVVLQHTETTVDELIASRAGWKIVEPSTNGRRSGDLSRGEVQRMKAGNESLCRSVVLAYLSIGEAEEDRSYWDPSWIDASGEPIPGVAPAWLGPEDPEREGSYKVRYWRQSWRRLLMGTPTSPGKTPLDRIIDQGFDGVYLDGIDAFEFWSQGQGELARRQARERMVSLIEEIAAYAQETRGRTGFVVMIQGGAEIVLDDAGRPDDLRDRVALAVRGLGLEDVFFDGTRRQAPQHTDRVLAASRAMFETLIFPAAPPYRIPLFAIDYVVRGRNENLASNRARATEFHRLAQSNGLVAYAARTNRELDEVLSLAGPRWEIVQPYEGCLLCAVCLADVGSVASALAGVGAGVPGRPAQDGLVDQSDFRVFMAAYQAGDRLADITGCTSPGDPAFGRPDGRVDFEDMALFVQLYSMATGR